MEYATASNRGKRPGDGASKLSVVEVSFSPGPDAQDRLRRLFTLLIKCASRDGSVEAVQGSPPDDGDEEKW